MVPREELRAHRQFVRRQAQRFTRDRFRNAIQLKQNVARTHCSDPKLWLAFAFTHTCFWWTRRYRFVRENTDPQLSLALHVAGKRNASGLQLGVRYPRTIECLQTKLTEVNPEVA